MRILLASINAKYIHSSLATRSIQVYAEQTANIQTQRKEFTINQQPSLLLREIYEFHPDVLGFSCYIWNISMVLDLVEEIKKILPETVVFLGGPEVSFDADNLLTKCRADFVIRGEGEKTFVQAMESLQKNGDYSSVPGVTYRDNEGRIVENPPQTPLQLDEIPFVYSDEDMEQFKNKIIYYESSRGCPYRCAYCLSSVEKGVRFLSLERTFHDLQFFLDHKVPQVKFVDRSFNCNPRHALAIWNYLAEHDNGITNFHCEINGDTLDQEAVDFLQTVRKGLFQFEIGIQTTNPDTLEQIHRKNDFDRIADIVGKLQKNNNIHLHLDLIAGLPQEDYQSFGASFNQVYRLGPDQFQLGFLKVLKGSSIWQNQSALGIVSQTKAPYEVLSTPHLPFSHLLRLKMVEEMTEQYYNSNRYRLSMRYLVSLFPTPFDCYQALGDFYHDNRYHTVSHSKEEMYTILYQFLQSALPQADPEVFRQLAKFDIYSHEKAKRLPQWLSSQQSKEEKQRILHFLEREEALERYLPQYQGIHPMQISRLAHLDYFPFHPVTREPVKTVGVFNYRNKDILGNAEVHFLSANSPLFLPTEKP